VYVNDDGNDGNGSDCQDDGQDDSQGGDSGGESGGDNGGGSADSAGRVAASLSRRRPVRPPSQLPRGSVFPGAGSAVWQNGAIASAVVGAATVASSASSSSSSWPASGVEPSQAEGSSRIPGVTFNRRSRKSARAPS